MAVSRYLIYKVKSTALNKHALFWGILFCSFWAVLDLAVFGHSIPPISIAWTYYVGAVYALLLTLSLSSLGMSFYFTFLYGLAGLRYVTKFGKYGLKRLLFEDAIASLVSTLFYGTIMLVICIAIPYITNGVLISPANLGIVYLSIVLLGMQVYLMGLALSLIVAKLNLARHARFVSFLILMLAFLLFVPGNVANLPQYFYMLPMMGAGAIAYWGFTGHVPPVGAWWYFYRNGLVLPKVNIWICIGSSIMWIVLFYVICLMLVGRTNPVPVEEIVR